MKQPKLNLGIRASITDATVLEIYILDYLYNGYNYDWSTEKYTETNWVKDVVAQVKTANPARIRIIIDCLGGDAGIGLALYNFLKKYSEETGAVIEVDVIGMCGSAATLPAMAASPGELKMARNSFMIIHEAWSPYASGRADELRKQAELTEKVTLQYAEIYALRTGKTVEEILALIKDGDYWMSGSEAVEQGFADATYNDAVTMQVMARVSADIEAAGYRNIPQTLNAGAADVTAPESVETPLPGPIKKILMNLSNSINSFLGHVAKPSVDAKVEDKINPALRAEVAALLQQPLTDMVAGLEKEIKDELTAAEGRISASISEKYEGRIKSLEEENTDLKEEVSANIGGPIKETGSTSAEVKPRGYFQKG